MQETSASDFLLWAAYLEHDVNAFHREDYYAAQITAAIRSLFGGSAKIEDNLIKFVQKAKKELDSETKAAMSLSFWKALTGVKDGRRP